MTGIPKNPWLGLHAYTEQDRLFGRDRESREVADIVCNNLLTIVYGRSGIGKSSLLRAGVFPRLRYDDFLPVYIRMEHNTDVSYLEQIWNNVCAAVRTSGFSMLPAGNQPVPATMRELLGGYAFRDVREGIAKHLLLVFDQFEEIFTLPDSEYRGAVRDFFGLLAEVLNEPSSSSVKGSNTAFRLLVCLREDYLYFLESYSATIPSLKRNRYSLCALSREQGREVICSPRPGLVDDGVANDILQKIDADGSDAVDPSILSLFMHELYEKGQGVITRENVLSQGDNIIADFYSDGMKEVSPRSAAYLEERLVTVNGYRHSLSYDDATQNGGVTPEELERLKRKRIITLEQGAKEGRQIIELSHDVLCPVVLRCRSERKLREEKERLAVQAKAARRRSRITLMLLFLAIAVVGSIVYLYLGMQRERNKMLAAQSRFVTKEAMELYEGGNTVTALALLAEVFPHNLKNPERPYVSEVYDGMRQICEEARIEKVLLGTNSWFSAVFTPDSKNIVVDGSVIFDIETDVETWGGRELSSRFSSIHSSSFSPDGKRIVTVEGEIAIIRDFETGDSLIPLDSARFASFSPDGKKVVTVSDSTVVVWKALSGEIVHILRGHTSLVNTAFFSPNGDRVVTASRDGTAIVWNTWTGDRLITLRVHTWGVNSASFSPDGDRVVTASEDKTSIVWDARTGKCLITLRGHTDGVNSAFFSPDGKLIVTNSVCSFPIVWDAVDGDSLYTLSDAGNIITSSCFSPDGKWLLVNGWLGGRLALYNVDEIAHRPSAIRPWGFQKGIERVSFTSDGKRMMMVSAHKAIVRNVESGSSVASLVRPFLSDLSYSSFSPEGKQIVALSPDNNTAIVLNVQTEDTICTLRGHTDDVWYASFSPDGKRIVTASWDDTAILWDAVTGDSLRMLRGHIGRVGYASFSPDGKRIVTASDDSTAILWDAVTGDRLRMLRGHIGRVGYASFSPDGKRIVTASWDDTAILWDAVTGDRLRILRGHASDVNSASFSPDGKRVVTTSDDGTAIVWDFRTGDRLATLQGHTKGVNSASFSLDGKRVVTASNDGTIRYWDLPDSQELIDRVMYILNGARLSLEDRRLFYLE